MRKLLLLSLLVVPACGGGGGGDDGDDTTAPDAMPGDWQTLITSSWTIAPGEQYRCERLTIDHDIWIKAFDGAVPNGHHHAVLTVNTTPDAPDGQVACNAGTNAPGMIYGNAPGVDAITFPDGIATKIPAGSQLLLNLHLFNTQPSGDISGTSTVLYLESDPVDAAHEAEIVLMGPVSFDVPTGDSEVSGGCTMTGATTLFMFTPHMHKLGVHAHVIATRAAGDLDLHDMEYAFDNQQFYDIGLVPMEQGDRVDITCSYHNEGAATTFGQSTTQEMCFASTYRYPKLGGAFGIICPN